MRIQLNTISFSEWLSYELNNKGWTASEMASRCHTNSATISRILNRERNAGPEICNAIARIFRIPPEEVFRKAGLLPELNYGPLDDLGIRELHDVMLNLSPAERREVIEYARFRYRLSQEHAADEKQKHE